MEVTLQYFEGCPHWQVAADRLLALAAGRTDISVSFQVIDGPEHAEAVGFHGSPSILVDGVDPFDDGTAVVGYGCRVYPTADGRQGCPTVEQLTEALRPTP